MDNDEKKRKNDSPLTKDRQIIKKKKKVEPISALLNFP